METPASEAPPAPNLEFAEVASAERIDVAAGALRANGIDAVVAPRVRGAPPRA